MEQDVARARTARSSRMRCTRTASSNGDPASGCESTGSAGRALGTAIDLSFGFLAMKTYPVTALWCHPTRATRVPVRS